MMRRKEAVVLALALLAAPGCLDPFSARLDAVPLVPRPIYRTLWTEVEACSGLHADFGQARWFVIAGTSFRCSSVSGNCRGAWAEPHNIYIAASFVDDSLTHYFTVRHEILHELGARPGHPPVFDTCRLRSPEQAQPPGPPGPRPTPIP